MRVVVQRVSEASVRIKSSEYVSINEGLLIFVGIEPSDQDEDIDWLVGKIARLRIFNDSQGIMNCSITEKQGEILVVSQFTLYASTKKGNRPSYSNAAIPEFAVPLYERFVERLRTESSVFVGTGIFGADMKVNLINDGPVTIIIDSKSKE
jgi:D-aminoacyl-tRNA deacylase